MRVLDGFALALAMLLISAVPHVAEAAAAAEPTECDRLASHPSDPDKVIEGVSQAQVLAWPNAAIGACRQAVEREPDNARVRYLLGRVLFYTGQKAEALAHLEASSQAHHRQAQFVLGLMYTDGVADILPADACRALDLWQDAAARDHYAARVALGRDFVRGQYDDCPGRPSVDTVDGWLESAGREARDYYQRLLISWAREVLAASP